MSVSVRFEEVSKKFTIHHGQERTLQEKFLNFFQWPQRRVSYTEPFWAMDKVSFEVEQGQTVGLVGSNGSGKSTALKLIARIIEPTSGQISIDGRVSALLELGTGFHPDLTGRENVFLSGSLMGVSRADIARCFDDIIAFSELEEFIDMPVKHYSSGMYTRLAFAVAIHVNPDILIIDEVLSVGDGAFQRKCMDRIGEMKRAGVTILMVSHDLDTVARLCTQVVWLDHGKVHRIGDGRSVISEYIAYINVQQQREQERQKQRQALQESKSTSQEGNPATVEENVETEVIASTQDGEILRIETLDHNRQPVTSIETGESLIVRLHYRANRRIEHPTFGIGLHRDDDVHIAGPNTQVADYIIDQIEGEGYIDYIVEQLPLAAGRYYLSGALYDETCTHCYDYVHQLHSFLVQPQTVWDQLGIIRLAATWELQASSTSISMARSNNLLITQ
jgi:ABC-type polysaccharide/polyol phosphate transport system ATPase subunit